MAAKNDCFRGEGSGEETANEDEEREFYDLQDLDKMWGEDDIDDVLEKLKFEDALKEICHNQEKLLQNQTETQQSLTAIDELLNKRLQKRQEALQIAVFSSVSTRRSPRSSMTPVSMDSTPTIVSCTSTPVITPPSSRSISLPSSNRSNSHLDGVDKNSCFSLDDRNDLTSFNARNNEDTPIVFEPSEFEKGMLTSKDNEIRNADVPERFQVSCESNSREDFSVTWNSPIADYQIFD